MKFLNTFLFFLCLAVSGCVSSPEDESSSPGDGEQDGSSLTPVVTSSPAPRPTPTPSLPEGVEMKVDGERVSLGDLMAGRVDPNATVTIYAKPETAYKDVSNVMDKVYKMGYLIQFSTLK